MNIGGLFRAVAPLALAAMTGGASLAVQAAMKAVITAVVQQVIQQVGQKLGLPQSVIDMAQMAFSATSGSAGGTQDLGQAVSNFGQLTDMSSMAQGEFMRGAQTMASNWTKAVLEGRDNGDGNVVGSSAAASKGKGSGADSFLVAFAKAMGKSMDDKMNKMMTLSTKIDEATQAANDSGGKKQAVTGQLTAELQALGQEIGMISQAVSNSLKSIGEANSALARKG